MNHIIPLIVPLLQEFFLANRVGDHNSQEVNIQIQISRYPDPAVLVEDEVFIL